MKVKAKTQKVLLIESDKALSYVLRNKLNAHGFETYCAYEGEQAFDLILKNKYDLIMLDLMINGGVGFEILKKIKDTSKNTKIVVLSSLEQLEDRERAKKVGFSAFLPKSSTPIPLLVKAVREMMGV